MSKPIIIYIFGNPDLAMDSLPLKILPALQKKFPQITFKHIDPNEDWKCQKHLIVLDTVVGIKHTQIFTNLKTFAVTPRTTLHDFDAYTSLRFLQKIGKLKKCMVIGIPPTLKSDEALLQTSQIITANLF